VAYNQVQQEEYHFYAQSNGWVTGVNRVKKEIVIRAFNSQGDSLSNPVLVDRASTKSMSRFSELQEKYHQEKSLSNKEFEEMCALAGLIKKE
jgi:hypothetical protein